MNSIEQYRKKGVPRWILKREGLTTRQWKSTKRWELKAVKTALMKYRSGCAYCPGYDEEFEQIDKALDSLIDKHSVKKWGR